MCVQIVYSLCVHWVNIVISGGRFLSVVCAVNVLCHCTVTFYAVLHFDCNLSETSACASECMCVCVCACVCTHVSTVCLHPLC